MDVSIRRIGFRYMRVIMPAVHWSASQNPSQASSERPVRARTQTCWERSSRPLRGMKYRMRMFKASPLGLHMKPGC